MPDDDFLEWLVSDQGQLSEQALFRVMDSLENCSVDPSERVIVWNDVKRLSIAQTAERIHSQSGLPMRQLVELSKKRQMRLRRLRKLIQRLRELQKQAPSRDQLLLKLGAAKKDAGRAYGLLSIRIPKKERFLRNNG